MSGTTSLENSNIPLVRVNRIVDDLEKLELEDFGAAEKTRPMTANATSKLKVFLTLFIRKKAQF
jgi:predicted transcriptional regulator